jgi:Histone methylation protein DOT1
VDARTFIRKAINRSKRSYGAATVAIRQAYERFQDRRHGVDTAGITYLETLSIDSPSRSRGMAYEGVPVSLFNRMMERLDIRHEDYVFIDLGSGKGRALLAASHYPFRELIGVEFAGGLHEIARSNLQTYLDRRGKNVRWRLEHGDAVEFQFPDENVVLFLFNPFDGLVLRSVLDNVAAYVRDYRKSIYIVYCNAKYAAVFDSYRQLVLQEAIPVPRQFGQPAGWFAHGIRIHRSVAPAASP